MSNKVQSFPDNQASVGAILSRFVAQNSTLLVVVLMLVAFGLSSDKFLLPNNIFNIFRQMSVVAVLALGMTLVILIGGIDLSVGSVLFLAAGITSVLLRDGTPVAIAILVGLSSATVAGLMNGLLVEVAGISPVIATLGTLIGVRGLTLVLMNNAQIRVTDPFFEWVAITRTPGIAELDVPGIPLTVIIVLIIYLIMAVVLRQTLFGRFIYAIGGNQVTAHLSGLPVLPIKLLAYTLCGLMAGIGGMLMAAATGVISPGLGAGSEFYTIAAVVLGGTRLSGGIGRVEKTLLGAFILYMVLNFMTLRRIPAEWQQTATGLLVLTAIVLDRLAQRRRG
ncbi:MAG: ABC transporter permease [Chloroflexi bacterium]|nr:ABC transporter permease [Chloroflexota bacterium]MCC6891743.1 ABC transporter permease [Anaerolineae bacterium]